MSAEINVEVLFFISGSARPPYYINYGNAHIIYEQEILVLWKNAHMIVPFSFPDSKRHTLSQSSYTLGFDVLNPRIRPTN